MKFCQLLSRLLMLLPILALGACSTSGPQGDTRMKLPDYYFLDPSAETAKSQDDMIRFESLHRLHGAISNEDRRGREGHYYTFPWTTTDKSSDASLLFEYRQANTGSQVHALRVPIEHVRRKNATHVEIIGEPYELNGKVTAWRATIERNGSAVASKQSYLWE